jgi:hypothetical protein
MHCPWYEPLGADTGPGPLERRWTWGDFHLGIRITADTVEVDGGAGSEAAEPTRFLRANGGDLVLTARTADRSVVARPAKQLVVLAEGRATIFVSSPLWVGVSEQGREPFAEFSTSRPKSTWLGATPQAGRLAYATRTRARADLGNLDAEPGRIITQVELVNHLDEPWAIERVEVPMPHLSVFCCESPQGESLWTSSVRVERSGETEVDAHVTSGPPAGAGTPRPLAGPRVATTPRLNLLALSRWRWS